MKKILMIALILTLILGCSKDEKKSESNIIPVTSKLLVGKWYYGDLYNFKTIQFRLDGTGRFDHIKNEETEESYKFTYRIDADGETIIIDKMAFITNESLGTTKAIIYNQDGSSLLFVVGDSGRFSKMSE